MADITAGREVLTTVDGVPLKDALARAERKKKTAAVILVMPLFLFIALTFLYPIALMLTRSIHDDTVSANLPNTIAVLEQWDGKELPGEEAFKALRDDLVVARETKEIGSLATRLNFEQSGIRSAVTKTGRRAEKMEAPFKDAMIDADPDWGDVQSWRTIKLLGNKFNLSQYAAAIDGTLSGEDGFSFVPEQEQIYKKLFVRTLIMSVVVTGACLLLGFPIAYLLSTLPLKTSNILMIMVLLPFWTSLLVRTTSWIVLLQTQGVLNDVLVWIGIVSDEGRLELMFNARGTTIAMTQILLPFMVLPLYSVMKTIPPSYMRAAQSLGAQRFLAFWRVYAPNTLPGVGAGCLLVFILAIGYYITPALVGGQDGQMISNLIAFHMQRSLNWGLAAALGSILLVGVLVLYWVYNKLVGIERLKLG